MFCLGNYEPHYGMLDVRHVWVKATENGMLQRPRYECKRFRKFHVNVRRCILFVSHSVVKDLKFQWIFSGKN